MPFHSFNDPTTRLRRALGMQTILGEDVHNPPFPLTEYISQHLRAVLPDSPSIPSPLPGIAPPPNREGVAPPKPSGPHRDKSADASGRDARVTASPTTPELHRLREQEVIRPQNALDELSPPVPVSPVSEKEKEDTDTNSPGINREGFFARKASQTS